MPKDASGNAEKSASHRKDPDETLRVIKACLAGVGALYLISNSVIVTLLGAATAVTLTFMCRLAR
ncbi:hypothetical protein [Amycolatopsis sp. lyj-112]|uniref:hypothetical protein n=1 Tax=Amycolatopsis sp. lyj-112 TaxID=2789288 RepID=UPI00397E1B17